MGFAELIVGILLLINPVEFASGIIVVCGIVLMICGLVSAIKYFCASRRTPPQSIFWQKGLRCC